MVLDILKELLTDFEVIHQTGSSEVYKDFETLSALADQLPTKLRTRYTLGKWFDTGETVNIFSKATVVVGRSGANTVVETMALGIPAVYIPLPISANNEQTKNAKIMEGLGAAVILPQDRLTPKRLLAAIRMVVEDYEKYRKAAKNAQKVLKLDAASLLAAETLKLVN